DLDDPRHQQEPEQHRHHQLDQRHATLAASDSGDRCHTDAHSRVVIWKISGASWPRESSQRTLIVTTSPANSMRPLPAGREQARLLRQAEMSRSATVLPAMTPQTGFATKSTPA